jgi:HlyD family secretion protein
MLNVSVVAGFNTSPVLGKDQDAMLRLTVSNQGTTPDVPVLVVRIGTDLTEDEKTGPGYCAVGGTMDEYELPLLGGLEPVPGMPVGAFIETSRVR